MDYERPARKHKRIKYPFIIKVRICQEETESEEYSEWDTVTTQDISAGGMYFNSPKKMKPGTVLEFNIALSFIGEDTKCRGKVCRAAKTEGYFDSMNIGKDFVYGVASQFTKIDNDKRDIINRFANMFCSDDGTIEEFGN